MRADPASSFTVLSKLLEMIVAANQLYNYVEDNKLLSKYQYEYSSYCSTEDALLSITEPFYRAIYCGDLSLLLLPDGIGLNIACPHFFLDKLGFLGIDARWFASYLTKNYLTKNFDRLGGI